MCVLCIDAGLGYPSRAAVIETIPMPHELDTIADRLDTHEGYRVLRRLNLGAHFRPQEGGKTFRAVFLDLETTGLNPDQDEIIEIGMVPFTYGSEGQIHSVETPFSKLREPSKPISEDVTKITNITNDMVHGKPIDPDEVFGFAEQAGLIIAHNAAFDRVFMERFAPEFADKPWACSMSQIPWKEEGFDGTRLSHIAAGFGFFYDAHRAVEDCNAGIEVLSRALPASNQPAMSKLLTAARQDTQRIWAVGAPYDFKDILKARGYRWNDGNDGRPKSWYLDVMPDIYTEEREFLKTEIYQNDINLPVTIITAKDRFSGRI